MGFLWAEGGWLYLPKSLRYHSDVHGWLFGEIMVCMITSVVFLSVVYGLIENLSFD